MTQKIKRNGITYEIPDDASLNDINSFFNDQTKSQVESSLSSNLTNELQKKDNVKTNNYPEWMESIYPSQVGEESVNFKNMFPPGQLEEMINAAAGGSGPKVVSGALQAGREAAEYLQPAKEIPKFMEKLGRGAKTSEENVELLARELGRGRIAVEEEALIPKREFLKASEGKDIYQRKLPNLNRIVSIFGEKLSELPKKTLEAISSEIKDFYKTGGDVDKFVGKLEEIFPHKELSEEQILKVEKYLPFGEFKNGSYFKQNTKGYNTGLKEVHDKFFSIPNAGNADKLMSGLKKSIRELDEKRKLSGRLSLAEDNTYSKLKNNLSSLESDFAKYVSNLPKKAQGKYKEFTNAWRSKVALYGDEDVIRHLSRSSKEFTGITSQQINKVFSNPTESTLKIISSLPDEARGHLLYNVLQNVNPNDVNKFANTILDLKKTKGYSYLVNKELEDFAKNLLKRQKNRSIVADLALFAGGSLTPAGPFGGALAVGAKHAYPHIAKVLGKYSKGI